MERGPHRICGVLLEQICTDVEGRGVRGGATGGGKGNGVPVAPVARELDQPRAASIVVYDIEDEGPKVYAGVSPLQCSQQSLGDVLQELASDNGICC